MTTDLNATEAAASLTASEWDELVCAADAAEHTVDLGASIYDSIKHWIEAVLPLHERMIRERLNAEAAVHAAELAEAKEKVRICEQQTARIDRENTRLRKEIDDLTIGLGLADGPRRRQLNDVIDVASDLADALLRHEGEL